MPRGWNSAINTALESGAMQIVRLLKITDALNNTLAFTDHTEDLTRSSVTYLARPGMDISATTAAADMSVDNTRVRGFFKTGTVTMADVLNGRFAGATYELFTTYIGGTASGEYDFGSIGEVAVIDDAFDIELRSEVSKVSRGVAKYVSETCDATLSDARCGYVHSSPNHSVSTTIASVTDAITFTATVSAATHTLAVDGWFNDGVLTWTSGDNDNYSSVVGNYTRSGDTGTFVLLMAPGQTLDVGDGFTVKSGCNKTFAICSSKFSNTNNFRGFPHLMGRAIFYPADNY